MIEVNEPQVWTLIGVFAASLLGVLTLMSTMFVRIIEARFDGLDAKVDAKFDAVDVRFEALERRFDHLDRDVQAIVRRVFPDHE